MKKVSFKGRSGRLIAVALTLLFAAMTFRSSALPNPAPHDARHDFDFNIGTWHTHISRLLKPLSGSKDWTELDGTVTIHKVWGGKAQEEEIEADGPGGHFEGFTLFLYNPKSQQWSMNFADSDDGILDQPSIGGFRNGRGEFYQTDMYNGRQVMVRMVWFDITANAHRVEQSFSDDGGKTWEPNFKGVLTRETGPVQITTAPPPVNHDFDFAFGTWKEHSSRLDHPLTGSKNWIEMDGKSTDRELWNGKGNLTELESDGPNGHLELLALRLYNPQAKQWYLTFATSNVGVLGAPATIGEFKNGKGEFYDQELYGDKSIWVRFIIFSINADAMQSEQAFSDDGGKTWETNWVNKYSRIKE